MDLAGAFSFSGLIKTLLPGLVWTLAFAWAVDAAWVLLGNPAFVLPAAAGSVEVAGVIALPLAVMQGLASNTLVFLTLNERLVRNPVRARTEGRDFWTFRDDVHGLIESAYAERLVADHGYPRARREAACKHLSAMDLVVLGMGAEAISFGLARYWAWLEFQLNALAAVTALGAVALVWLVGCSGLGAARIVPAVAGVLVVVALWDALMLVGARNNYDKHERQMLNLRVAALVRDPALKDAPRDPDRGGAPEA